MKIALKFKKVIQAYCKNSNYKKNSVVKKDSYKEENSKVYDFLTTLLYT